MKLKTYTAATMAQALAEVKKDLGKDAVILHTRVYRHGAVMGLGGKQVVEITASDQAAAVPKRTSPQPMPVIEPKAATRLPSTRVEPSPVDERGLASLREDLAAIKRMVGQALAGGVVAAGPLPGALAELAARLRGEGVAAETLDAVVGGVRSQLAGHELADATRVRAAGAAILASGIACIGSITPGTRQRDGRPLTIALVGPTGVGKTTTIAKLAAAYKLRYAKRVGLVTCDTYRIAAVEQLKTYASIIDVPLRVALSDADVAEACRALAECDVVILDTPGRSQHDAPRLDDLAACVRAASPHETHLVLSAAVAPQVLAKAAALFARVRPDRAILTKLDEAVTFGPLANVLRASGLRASYFTTGQEVPDQIEVASASRLASLVVGLTALHPGVAPTESAALEVVG